MQLVVSTKDQTFAYKWKFLSEKEIQLIPPVSAPHSNVCLRNSHAQAPNLDVDKDRPTVCVCMI